MFKKNLKRKYVLKYFGGWVKEKNKIQAKNQVFFKIYDFILKEVYEDEC